MKNDWPKTWQCQCHTGFVLRHLGYSVYGLGYIWLTTHPWLFVLVNPLTRRWNNNPNAKCGILLEGLSVHNRKHSIIPHEHDRCLACIPAITIKRHTLSIQTTNTRRKKALQLCVDRFIPFKKQDTVCRNTSVERCATNIQMYDGVRLHVICRTSYVTYPVEICLGRLQLILSCLQCKQGPSLLGLDEWMHWYPKSHTQTGAFVVCDKWWL